MIKVAVVGVGYLGQHHARILSSIPGCMLTGVVDADAKRARQIAELYGTVPVNVQDIIGKVDAVSIAVPTIDHFMVASAFLNAGTHVLVEKPVTATVEEAEILISLARSRGKILFVGHTERFNPAFQAARGKIVNPGFIEAHRLGVFAKRSTDIDVVLDLMIHDIDLILSVVNDQVQSVDSIGVSALTDKVDIANARVSFKRGCVANITASRISRDKVRKIRIFQPQSYISIDCGEREAQHYYLLRDGAGEPKISVEGLKVDADEPLRREILSFLGSVRDGNPPEVSGEDGRRALELAFSILNGMKRQ